MKDKVLRKLASSFAGKRILIVGDVMLDEYIWGDVRRISPEAPVPVVEYRRQMNVPGGAGNTAANVRSLGGEAILCGVVGGDWQAETLREALRRGGVAVDGLITEPDRLTTTKTRIVAHHQQMVRIDRERREPLSPQREDELIRWVEKHLAGVEACIVSDYSKGVVTTRVSEQLIRLGKQSGKPVIVDPKGTNYIKYRGATVVKPNVQEAGHFLNREIQDDASLHEVGGHLTQLLEGSAVLITRGAQGMTLFRSSLPPIHIPSVARDVFDVTGAGDTVISTLALSLAAGATLEQAAHLANWAAGIVVGKVGTTTVSLEELLNA